MKVNRNHLRTQHYNKSFDKEIIGMNFWTIAIALLAIPALLVCWPLVRGTAADRITGLFIVVITPLAGILLYQSIGTPEAIGLPSASARNDSICEATFAPTLRAGRQPGSHSRPIKEST